MTVYTRPDIPRQSSYAPEVCAKLNNPAQLYIPGETGALNNQIMSIVYWQTYPNRGRPSSDLEGFSQIYTTGEENWFLDRFEIGRADPPSSIFTPLPLDCERSSFQYSHPLPIREGRVGFADVFIDQRLLLHCPSRDWTQIVFHLSSPIENNGGAEVGRGVLYDSGGSFELGSRGYSLSAFAGRMCIYALRGIEIVDFVESPYLKDIQTI
ncbi:hypothetical protein DL96DRAFT_1609418 [Flagelloscypha sp. PMI_526]|nr:hypothetical protein DL96DRAFT_1609418 [Flagelloscypha sp. PMI_526]